MNTLDIKPENNSCCTVPYIACITLAFIYVGSLYIWKRTPGERSTHPSTMKKRFVSVLLVVLFAPLFVQYFINPSLLKDMTLWEVLGFRLEGLVSAIVLPLLLTMILFLGPITMQVYHGMMKVYQPYYWTTYMKELIWIRNYVVAPVSEEFTFRSCMLALIIHCTEPMRAVFICPLFFGAAHLHHMLEQIRFGARWKDAASIASFQFLYTTLFGAYSAYLFLRTGHLIAPVLVHSFCNHMGFPDFGGLSSMPRSQKLVCSMSFILGIILWTFLLKPMTNPSLYNNKLPWSSQI